MTNEEIKNRILIEMQGVIGYEELQKLKFCLERNFYGVTITDNCTDIVEVDVVTVDTLIKKFALEKKIERLSDKSIAQYVRETRKFFDVVQKNYNEVTYDDINYYLATMMMRNISVNSVDNSRKFIKAFFKWLYEKEYIQKDIFIKVKPIKRIDKQKEFLTNNEIVKLRDECKDNIRALALIDFLLATGVRVSECSNLKLENVNFNTGEVMIYSTKTSQWRTVYLDSNAMKHLCDYLNERNDVCNYVFATERKVKGRYNKMNSASITSVIHKYCDKAGINKHCSVHLFRKTLATRLYSKGMDVSAISKILGHTNTTTTEKYYLTICGSDVKYMYNKCAS